MQPRSQSPWTEESFSAGLLAGIPWVISPGVRRGWSKWCRRAPAGPWLPWCWWGANQHSPSGPRAGWSCLCSQRWCVAAAIMWTFGNKDSFFLLSARLWQAVLRMGVIWACEGQNTAPFCLTEVFPWCELRCTLVQIPHCRCVLLFGSQLSCTANTKQDLWVPVTAFESASFRFFLHFVQMFFTRGRGR